LAKSTAGSSIAHWIAIIIEPSDKTWTMAEFMG
jgi:hypothetical protein